MNYFSTGEVAKMLGVSVRTIQYYDQRKLLSPSKLTEGGRRQYSQEDINHLKILIYLKDLGFSLKDLEKILAEKNSPSVINTLLTQQALQTEKEIYNLGNKLKDIKQLQSLLDLDSSYEKLQDTIYMMETKQQLKQLRLKLFVKGIILDVFEIILLVYAIKSKNYIILLLGFILVFIIGIFLAKQYMDSVAYICPECHTVFQPTFKQSFFARHTPKTRKLVCPTCHKESYCIEVFKVKEPES